VTSISQQAHQNLCDFTRFLGRLEPAATVLDDVGIVAVRGATDWPSARLAVRADPQRAPAVAFVDSTEAFLFADDGRTACIFIRDTVDDEVAALLLARGFREYGNSPEMVCEQALEHRYLPPGITVRLAESAADVRAYAEIAGQAFRHLGLHEDATRTTIDNPDVVLQPDVAVALAELDGRIVAGALVLVVGPEPNGYVSWVACHDDARGRGLGDVVTRRVTNEAFARGAQMVRLEASRFGESTYARMGYRELYRYRMLIKI
jgi:ribosomal protein S18 acetylase RimI-like enzyme